MSGASAIEGQQHTVDSRLVAAYGFVPNIFRAQMNVERVVDAEACPIEAVFGAGKRLAVPVCMSWHRCEAAITAAHCSRQAMFTIP